MPQELERTLHDTQLLLEMRMYQPSVVIDENALSLGATKGESPLKSRGRDDTGTNAPSGERGIGHQEEGYSPRKRQPGGLMAHTASSQDAVTSKHFSGKDESVGPPFRSAIERRQWLLQEKKRWLVEMRLGK